MRDVIAASERESGAFERQEDAFRQWVKRDGSTPFTPTEGRYHLYISLACPWAHRTLIVRNLRGLENVVSYSVVDPVRTEEEGWAFREGPGYTRDPINGFSFLKEAYLASNPSFKGRWTVPVLWDKQTRQIVNNSEDDICRMFNDEFSGAAQAANLFPLELSDQQNKLSEEIYAAVNNGVYAAGFATRQSEYEKAARTLFKCLDALNAHLETRRFLLGGNFVETDWRLFCTLVRFDAVYHGHFKCNLRRIVDYPQLQRYLKSLYAVPGIAATVNFDHIKRHYYITHEDINPTRIVSIGPALELS